MNKNNTGGLKTENPNGTCGSRWITVGPERRRSKYRAKSTEMKRLIATEMFSNKHEVPLT